MKVLQINTVCGTGSTGRIVTDIYRILEEQGDECLIAYGRGTSPQGINSIKIGTKLDIYKHVAKTRLLDKHGFSSTRSTIEFLEKVKEYNPDVIQLHNVHGYYVNIELLFEFLKETDKSVIWTLHDCWTFTGHCAHFDYIRCEQWKDGCNKCPQKGRYPKSLFMDSSKRNYERKKQLFTGIKNMTIVTPSKWLARLVKESFLSEYNIKVINNGIDLNVFKPTESDFRKKYNIEDKFIILGVTNVWDERKGLKYFLELSKLITDCDKIVLVGLNDKQLINLPKNVIGIKRTNSVEALTEIYSAADVFINPTLEDNFPTTNLEALACGTPVITFNTGGSAESVDKNCGIVVGKGNITDLIKAINTFKSNPIGNEACLAQSKNFDKRHKFLEYMQIYKHLEEEK